MLGRSRLESVIASRPELTVAELKVVELTVAELTAAE
jgi:hypothetical protein